MVQKEVPWRSLAQLWLQRQSSDPRRLEKQESSGQILERTELYRGGNPRDVQKSPFESPAEDGSGHTSEEKPEMGKEFPSSVRGWCPTLP